MYMGIVFVRNVLDGESENTPHNYGKEAKILLGIIKVSVCIIK